MRGKSDNFFNNYDAYQLLGNEFCIALVAEAYAYGDERKAKMSGMIEVNDRNEQVIPGTAILAKPFTKDPLPPGGYLKLNKCQCGREDCNERIAQDKWDAGRRFAWGHKRIASQSPNSKSPVHTGVNKQRAPRQTPGKDSKNSLQTSIDFLKSKLETIDSEKERVENKIAEITRKIECLENEMNTLAAIDFETEKTKLEAGIAALEVLL
jgi:hypothetical protein